MAINPETQYPGKTAPSTPEYPYGSARNITVPGDGTGTPWEAALVNDLFGFQQAILSEAAVVPTGTPDEANDSQYLTALKKLLTDNVVFLFADVANLKTGQLLTGLTVNFARLAQLETYVDTKIHNATSGAGGARYLIQTDTAFGGVPDDVRAFYVGGGTDYVASLVPDGAMDARKFGAVGNDSTTPSNAADVVESAKDICSTVLFPSPNGEVYRFGFTPDVTGLTCLFDSEAACSNRTLAQVNGIVIGEGDIGGYVQCDELDGRQIEVVCGTIRQDSTTRTNWNWIKDANHEPIGVDDTTPAVARGSEITINFLKTYNRVLSLVCGPDEDFANAAGMKVGASVGLSSIAIKASLDKRLAAYVEYTGGGRWGITYGAGQGGSSNHNIEITSVSHDNGTGITTIEHDCLPGLDVCVSGYSGGATLAGGVPYIPVVHSVTNGYTAGTYQIQLKWIDPSTGSFVLVQNAPMAVSLAKGFSAGAFLDGTNGTDAWDLDKGNIWFYGIFEL